jgi:hypothetical protein
VERGNAEKYGFHEAHHPVVRHCDDWVGSRFQHALVFPGGLYIKDDCKRSATCRDDSATLRGIEV